MIPDVDEFEGQSAAAFARTGDADPDSRPTAVLRSWAELLAGERIDDTSGRVGLTKAEIVARWQAVRPTVAPSAADLLAWHRHEVFWLPVLTGWVTEDRPAALPHLDALVAADPHVPEWRQRRGMIHARTGQIAAARADLEAAVALGADDEVTVEAAALLAVRAGDGAAARKHVDLMFRRGRATNLNPADPTSFYRMRLASSFEPAARQAALANLPGADFAALARECDGIDDAPDATARAAVSYRAGRFADAAEVLAEQVAQFDRQGWTVAPETLVWLAMAEYRLGRRFAAGLHFARALVRTALPDTPQFTWKERLALRMLLEEAIPLLTGRGAARDR